MKGMGIEALPFNKQSCFSSISAFPLGLISCYREVGQVQEIHFLERERGKRIRPRWLVSRPPFSINEKSNSRGFVSLFPLLLRLQSPLPLLIYWEMKELVIWRIGAKVNDQRINSRVRDRYY